MIVMCGPAGVGKSTWSQALVGRLEARGEVVRHWEEDLSDPALLRAYYADPQRWALASQLHFLLAKARTYEQASSGDVVERAIEEDVLFAQVNHSFGRLTDSEWRLYQEVYQRLKGILQAPSLYVLLTADFDTIVERMKVRSREGELDRGLDYWHRLYAAYQRWGEVLAQTNKNRMLVWDVVQNDIEKYPEAIEVLADEVLKRRNQTQECSW